MSSAPPPPPSQSTGTNPTYVTRLSLRTFRSEYFYLVSLAFIFVASLAWNNALTNLFTWIFGPENTLLGQFVYAISITAIIVLILYLLHFFA